MRVRFVEETNEKGMGKAKTDWEGVGIHYVTGETYSVGDEELSTHIGSMVDCSKSLSMGKYVDCACRKLFILERPTNGRGMVKYFCVWYCALLSVFVTENMGRKWLTVWWNEIWFLYLNIKQASTHFSLTAPCLHGWISVRDLMWPLLALCQANKSLNSIWYSNEEMYHFSLLLLHSAFYNFKFRPIVTSFQLASIMFGIQLINWIIMIGD